MEFNDKQKQALDLDRNISLTAGAGTGKTRVLVERYVRAIREDRADISRILALTFTEKAAAEMKIRVRQAFAEIIGSAQPGIETRKWEEQLEQFRNPNISTFHSFCSGLLREFPIEAGVDPAFDVLDEARSVLLQRESIDMFMEQRDRGGDPDLRTLSALWRRDRVRDALLALLGKRHASLQWAARARALAPADMEAHMRALSADMAGGPAVRSKCAALLDGLNSFQCSDPADKLFAQVQAVCAALDKVVQGGDPDFSGVESVRLTMGSKKNWDDLPGVKDVLRTCRDLARGLKEFQFTEKDRFAAEAAVSLARLFADFVRDYEQCKGDGVLLDFDDLEQKTLELLSGHAQVRGALRARFRCILIDEFQDTNDIQWDIIRMIAADEKSDLLQSNTFVVGDEKQSIYAFRGANVAVFDRARNDIVRANESVHTDGENGRIEMDICYRSRDGLIRFFNKLFSQVFGAAPDEDYLAHIAYFPIACHRSDDPGGACVEFLVSENPAHNEDEAAAFVDDAAAVARRIRMLAAEGYAFSDVAVLFYSRTHLDDYKNALRAEGVPFRTVGGFGFFECREVLDLVGIVNFLAHPGDNLSLLAALRSPHIGLSDEDLLAVAQTPGTCLWRRLARAAQNPAVPGAARIAAAYELLHRWGNAAGRISLGSLLRNICRDTGIMGTLGAMEHPRQARHNLEKLIGMARAYELREDAGLHGFSAWLETMIQSGAREPEATVAGDGRDAVQLMTIHASKGLEFRAVVVPQMGDRKHIGTGSTLLIDEVRARQYEVGFSVPDPGQGYEHASSAVRNMLKHVVKRKEEEELKRLLYVACTRARDKLVLAGMRRDIVDNARGIEDPSSTRWDELVAHSLAAAPEESGVEVFLQNALESAGTVNHSPGRLNAQQRISELLNMEGVLEATDRLAWFAPLVRDTHDAMAFSVREIASYAASPQDYMNRHVLGIPLEWSMRAESGRSAGLSPLVRGNVVHEVFENLPQIAPGDEQAALEIILKNHGITDVQTVQEFIAHYAPLAERFRATPQGRAAIGPQALRELPFVLEVGRWRVRGVIDLLYSDPGCCRVIDYKTDMISENQVLDKNMHYRLQLELYALAALQGLPHVDRVLAGLYFVEPDVFGEPVEVTRTGAQEIIERVEPMLEKMETLHRQCEQGAYHLAACEAEGT